MVKQSNISILQPRRAEHQELLNSHSPHLHSIMCYYEHGSKKPKTTFLQKFLLLCIISCSLVFASRYVFCSDSALCPLFCSLGRDNDHELQIIHSLTASAPRETVRKDERTSSCFSVSNFSTVCCDRSAYRTDICYMNGDIRTHSVSSSVILYTSNNNQFMEQKIKPYPRKWETDVMSRIPELRIRTKTSSDDHSATLHCDVQYNVTAVVFSTGGYTGNVYHDFNDGLIPLYITSRHLNKKVIFVILQYREWWFSKYGDIISQLSDYPPIDYLNEKRIHCFPKAIVGLQIHDELTVDAAKMKNNESIRDFHQFLDTVYSPRVRVLQLQEAQSARNISGNVNTNKPKLVIFSRNGSRSIENEVELVAMAEQIGFTVEIISPRPTMEMANIYKSLNSCDALIGVHGAGLTHLLFMKPGAVFIQIVPLGMDWAAEKYYAEPAKKLGLMYFRYKIIPQESSLYSEYDENDPVLKEPNKVVKRGWQVIKTVYLDRQKIRLDFSLFHEVLVRSHGYIVSQKKLLSRNKKQKRSKTTR